MAEQPFPDTRPQDITSDELQALGIGDLDGIVQRIDPSTFPPDVKAAFERASEVETTPAQLEAILRRCAAFYITRWANR